MSTQHAQYMLLFLVLAVNSDQSYILLLQAAVLMYQVVYGRLKPGCIFDQH